MPEENIEAEQTGVSQVIEDPFRHLNVPQLENLFLQSYNNGKYVQAFLAACESISRNPDKPLYMLRLSAVAAEVRISVFVPSVKKALLASMRTTGIDCQKFLGPWIDTFLADPAHPNMAALFNSTSDEEFEEKMDWPSLKVSLQDEFIVQGFRSLVLSGMRLEFMVLRLRRWLLLTSRENKIFNSKTLPFLCALAENCFFTEYAYSVTPAEQEIVEKIRSSAEKGDAEASDIALLGCYMPLHRLSNAAELAAEAPGKAMKLMMYLQVESPAEEQKLKQSIKTISPITDAVSEKVQEMYEDNPYPRWRDSYTRIAPTRGIDGNILIAGCGTGRPAVQIALKFPDLKITAVDLSRSSIAYAMRKARENEATNIEFLHGDILELDKLGKQFDLIDCSGVLHHMKDPVAGWKQLIGRLKPGGRMNIGLYSAKARKQIINARLYAAEHGYEATADGIRAFRTHVLEMPDDDPLKTIVARKDFYSLSECRDLVFHIQETNYTLPEIRKILEDLNLSFLYFKFNSPQITRLYSKTHPEDPGMRNLENWRKLEETHPGMFIGMYQFLCCRKGEENTPNAIMTAIEETGFLKA